MIQSRPLYALDARLVRPTSRVMESAQFWNDQQAIRLKLLLLVVLVLVAAMLEVPW